MPRERTVELMPGRMCGQPTKTSPRDAEMAFRVWGDNPSHTEDKFPWKCLAAFRFLQEALDYIAYCQDRGSDVVFQSPADCHMIKASDRRVCWKPIPEATGGDPPRTPKYQPDSADASDAFLAKPPTADEQAYNDLAASGGIVDAP